MTSDRAALALAAVSAAVVDDPDVSTFLGQLLRSCGDVLTAAYCGILIGTEAGTLDVLGSATHRPVEVDVLGAMTVSGPGVEAFEGGLAVMTSRSSETYRRWPRLERVLAVAEAGVTLGLPMRWHGTTIGSLVLVRRQEPFGLHDARLAQAFSDLATLLVVSSAVDVSTLSERIRQVLAERVVIEQAKGVLAERLGTDMMSAHEHLVRRSLERGLPLEATARAVVDDAVGRR